MIEERVPAMTEEQIRARFRCAPRYYLQAKLEKARLTRPVEEQEAANTESPREVAVAEQSQVRVEPQVQIQPEVQAQPQLQLAPRRQPARIEPVSLDIGLPGLEILDAALSESEYLPPSRDDRPDPDSDLTQQSILESALADYAHWPIVSAADLEPAPKPKLEQKLKRMLESEPELEQMLDLELQSLTKPESIPDNVTVGDFGSQAPGTVRVVSVIMDRKHPNMVRVVSESTRLAS